MARKKSEKSARKAAKNTASKAAGSTAGKAAGSTAGKAAGSDRESKATTKTEETTSMARPRTAFDSFRDNVEALVIAIILAIIIRHFAVEAFEIPTGSMAPTLYGRHLWIECPNCPTEFNVGLRTDSVSGALKQRPVGRSVYRGNCENPKCDMDLHDISPGHDYLVPGTRIKCQSCSTVFQGEPGGFGEAAVLIFPGVRCPLCSHHYRAAVESSADRNGNKILVNKYAYKLGKPERFDVIVFEFDRWKNYIKRLIGLPGETIHVYGGDIYVDGKIVRKGDHPYVQSVMWRQTSDSDVVENGLSPSPAWEETPLEGNNLWSPQQQRTRWSVNHPGGERPPAALEYQRPLDSYVNYNLASHGYIHRSILDVGDIKVAFDTTPFRGSGWLGVEIRDGEFTFRIRLPVGGSATSRKATIEQIAFEETPLTEAPVIDLRAEAPFVLATKTSTHIEIENIDDQVIVSANGERVVTLDYVSCPDVSHPSTLFTRTKPRLRILGSALEAELRSLKVFTDLYYYGPLDPPLPGGLMSMDPVHGRKLLEGQYFALGDNSTSSADGRYWGFVPEENLMGKALLIFWPAWPQNFQCKFIR